MTRPTRRRLLQGSLALTSLGLLASCGVVPGPWQPTAKVPRIGYVVSNAPGGKNAEALADGLREVGYVEGHTLTVEWRSAGGRPERLL